jgi:hypothetical protein
MTTRTIKPNTDYYYHSPYLLLNGSEKVLEDILLQLKHLGVAVDYHATPKYPCRNGLEYDWFVKLTDSPPIAQVFDFINKYNNQIITGKVLQLEDHAELEKRYAELQNQISTIQKQASSHNDITSTQVSMIGALKEELRLFEDDNKELVEKLRSQEAAISKISEVSDQSQSDLQIAEMHILTLKSKLFEIQTPPDKRGIEYLLKALWKEVDFLRNSVARIEMECDYDLVMPILRKIIDHKLQGKPVHSASGWHEVHFSTGNNNDGRIYFTYQIGAITRKIIVSKKDSQKVDIDFMKKCKIA